MFTFCGEVMAATYSQQFEENLMIQEAMDDEDVQGNETPEIPGLFFFFV